MNRDAASLALSVAAPCTGPTVVLEAVTGAGSGPWPTATGALAALGAPGVDEVAIEPLESGDESGTGTGRPRGAET